MLAVVWFSFPPHYGMLAESVASVRAMLPPDTLPVIVIEEDHPAPDVGAEVIRIQFDRGNHLSGRPAVTGVLRSLATVARDTGASDILKMDSDMVLTSGDWFRPGRISLFRRTGAYYGIYSAPSAALTMLDVIHSRRPFLSGHEANAIGSGLSIVAHLCGTAIEETMVPDLSGLPCRFLSPDPIAMPSASPGEPNPPTCLG